jgi:hypothetical protein
MGILDKYLNFLWEMFMFDMDIFSEPWMYIPFLIPIAFYLIFFTIKWTVLLMPLSIVSGIAVGILRKIFRN